MEAGRRVFSDATQSSPSGCKKLGKHGSRKGAVRHGSDGHTSTAEASTYYYHSDHLGSAHLITDYKGDEYERVEYTPYGEYWIEKRAPENKTLPFKFTGKERDEETGLYYYGARYLDAKTSRWLTTDPALGEYIPMAPVNDEAKKHNQNLPGMGGIYNTVNFHLYHYAGNNPIRYTDPDGNTTYLVVSTFQGGGRENQGTNFDDAAATRTNEIKSDPTFNSEADTVILKKIDSVAELQELLESGNIDSLEMYGHGTEDSLCIGSGDGPGKREYLTKENLAELNPKAFNKGAKIVLNQCNTANERKIGFFAKLFGKQTIAKDMSDYFGVTVTGNKGGSTGVPNPDAEVDYNWVHKSGEPIYYKATAGTETYEK